VHGLRRTYHWLRKSFWAHPMELLGDVGHVESYFASLEIVLMSVQDRSIVCAKCNIATEIVLHAAETSFHLAHVESRFGLFGDSVSFGAR
jgi:hypothetical protein